MPMRFSQLADVSSSRQVLSYAQECVHGAKGLGGADRCLFLAGIIGAFSACLSQSDTAGSNSVKLKLRALADS